MLKTSNKTNKIEHLVENKITYSEETLYKLPLPLDLHPVLKVGAEVEEDDIIKPQESNVEPEIEEIHYKGETDLLPGTHIKTGDPLYVHKKLFKKETVTSPVSGIVKDITENLITIEVKDEDEKEIPPFKTPFGGEIKAIQHDYILLNFPSLQINLFESKGGSAVGPIKYLSSTQIKDRKNLPARVEKSIIVTDQITADLYPMLSTLGVGAIIANSIDYSLYRNMIILAVPIGIISGFGYTPHEKKTAGSAVTQRKSEVKPVIKEDEVLIKYINSIEGKTVWVDGDYGRLIIPETKEPMSLKRHHWKLNLES